MSKNKNACEMQTCLVCRLSLKEWLPAVEAQRKNIAFKKGEMIFKEGDEVKDIYFVYKGKVKVQKQWGEDKELILRFAGPGDILGHRGMGKEYIYPISATALEPTVLCSMSLDFFKSSLKVNAELTYKLLMFYADELQESEKRMRNLAHMPVKGRVAYALHSLLEKFGISSEGFIDINISRQDIASFAGTTYESAFRVMSEFVQENIIAVEDKNILIKDAKKLLEIADDNSKS
ncbi:Crp/Fnr family transcriptional regulator [Parasediminibacterium sp. JCM 36343]|uniref:Crp/Fnr family transcriptional regulator n=1 Tax=Parasediminibacterium sp. JCM 36343 TaxID=3374279 RepID=UPI00397CD4AC